MSSNNSPKQLAIKAKTPSTLCARKNTVRHPFSLRLPAALEDELRKEAKAAALTLRDYIRVLLEERAKPKTAVEEVGAGHIKALGERLEQSTKEELTELRNTLLVPLQAIQLKSEHSIPEEISRRVHSSVSELLEKHRQEAKRTAKEHRQDGEPVVFGCLWPDVKSMFVTAGMAIVLSVLSVIAAVCFIHGVFPWEVPEITEKLAATRIIPEHICFAPAVKQQDGTGKLIPQPTPASSQKGGKR